MHIVLCDFNVKIMWHNYAQFFRPFKYIFAILFPVKVSVSYIEALPEESNGSPAGEISEH